MTPDKDAAIPAARAGSATDRAVPQLPGDDIGAMKDFYVGKLGFKVRWEFSDDGKTGMMGLARGGMELTVDCPMSGHGRNVCVVLQVEDADAYYEEWKHTVHIRRPPRDEVWGGRTFGTSDPAGNTVFVIGPVSQGRG